MNVYICVYKHEYIYIYIYIYVYKYECITDKNNSSPLIR